MKNFDRTVSTKTKVVFLVPILGVVLAILACNWQVENFSNAYTFQEVQQLPSNNVGLVLGTSKRLRNGQPNPYFHNRIDAATQLYNAGKVKYILVSGDNGSKYYNEPLDMKKALVEKGIPEEAIYMDFAGFRTLDSVIRCKEIFGQSSFTVISQGFHNKRAVFISRMMGINAIGYDARDVQSTMKMSVREVLARVKTFIDLYVLDTQPRFLGEAIQIGKV